MRYKEEELNKGRGYWRKIWLNEYMSRYVPAMRKKMSPAVKY